MSLLDKKGRNEKKIFLKKEIAEIVKKDSLSLASKAAIREEVSAQISSTVELILTGQQASLPTPQDKYNNDYQIGLKLLLESADLANEIEAKQLMDAKEHNKFPRPLGFYKSRQSDGAMILQDSLGRFFVYFNSHSSKSKYAKNKIKIKNLVDTRTGKEVNFSSSTGTLLPLKMGKREISEFINKGTAKSYKLIKTDKNNFNLAVSFEFIVDKIETETFLGIDRGIEAIASYAIYNKEKILKSGIYAGSQLREYQREKENFQRDYQKLGKVAKKHWRGHNDHVVHDIANKIIKTALTYKSQVVLENLKNIANGHYHKRKKYSRKSNFNRLLSRQQYQKLQKILEYKLVFVGLPKPVSVSAAYTSIICNVCGCCNKKNRITQSSFKCVTCKHEDNADINASKNISMKYHWLNTQYIKKTKKMKCKFQEWVALNSLVV